MHEFLQQLPEQLVNGFTLGSYYALIALGYTMVYGVLRFINFAHGDVFMVGAFVGYYTTGYVLPKLGGTYLLPGILALMLVSMVACGLLGIVIEKLAYRPLRSRPKLTVLITAIGVSLLLEYGGQFVFGAGDRNFFSQVEKMAPDFRDDHIEPWSYPLEGWDSFGLSPDGFFTSRMKNLPQQLGDIGISPNILLIFGATIFLLVALTVIVKYTRMGMAMRAVSNNATAAALMGVNTDTVISFTFGLGSALAGAAAVLFAITHPAKVNPLMGLLPGVKAFVAAVLGGIGNIPGAALGGLLIGLVETFVEASPYSTYRDAVTFGILILILLFKPSGLLGRSQIEKV